jgi:electron transfer flavoprotein beta subunit
MSREPLVVACVRAGDRRPDVDPLTGTVTRDARRVGLSAADETALEHALRAAEAWSGRALVVCAGPPAADAVLRDALALGADVLRIDWPPAARQHAPHGELEDADAYVADLAGDERPLARAIAAAVGPADLVLCGDRSADRGSGALPALLAHELGAAQALGLVDLRVDGERLVGERRLDRGRRERLAIPRPAVCSVEGSAVRLRRAPLAGVLTAGQADVPTAAADPVAPAVAVRRLRADRPRTHVVAPPSGETPRERLVALTGALVAHDPPTIVGPVGAAEAADALLAFLERHGYASSPAPEAAR